MAQKIAHPVYCLDLMIEHVWYAYCLEWAYEIIIYEYEEKEI